MQILNYNKNNIFKLDVPKLYTKKKNNSNYNGFFAISSIIIIVILFNINRGLKN